MKKTFIFLFLLLFCFCNKSIKQKSIEIPLNYLGKKANVKVWTVKNSIIVKNNEGKKLFTFIGGTFFLSTKKNHTYYIFRYTIKPEQLVPHNNYQTFTIYFYNSEGKEIIEKNEHKNRILSGSKFMHQLSCQQILDCQQHEQRICYETQDPYFPSNFFTRVKIIKIVIEIQKYITCKISI